jgi:hypothetical protein
MAILSAVAASHRDVKPGKLVYIHPPSKNNSPLSIFQIRGGNVEASSVKKSKASKKSTPEMKAKNVINEKMKESDAASAMGDAIRLVFANPLAISTFF